MSAIVGTLSLDGDLPTRAAVSAMLDRVGHRGPDASALWLGGTATLGHAMLRTTPEALHETQPFAHAEHVITADARIDNRTELLAALDLPQSTPDSYLLLAAYIRWGTTCPEQLIGDFAFAIWDERAQRLFCARDHFGVRPFYYHHSARLFAFGSEIKALLALPEVPADLDAFQIGVYLADILGFYGDTESTCYRHIRRLPPATWLMIDKDGARQQRYWQPDLTHEIRLESDAAYAEAFRTHFEEAVRCRLRSAYPVGSLLSGGLDSSAVACTARNLLKQTTSASLYTFYSDAQLPERDESAYVQMVLAGGGIAHTNVPEPSPFGAVDALFAYQDELLRTTNPSVFWALYESAHAQGVRVLLDGDDGDTTVSHGTGYLYELMHTNQWQTFIAETSALAAHFNNSYKWYLNRYTLTYLTDRLQHGHLRRWFADIRAVASLTDTSFARLVRKSNTPLLPPPLLNSWRRLRGGELLEAAPDIVNPTIASQFAAAIGLNDHARTLNQAQAAFIPRTEREQHRRDLLGAGHQHVLEENGHAAAAWHIETRHPFRDKRLVEFCLALPPTQKLRHGWSRRILRVAMETVLPPAIQWRTDKTDFTPSINQGMFVVDKPFLDARLHDHAILEPYLDMPKLYEIYAELLASAPYTRLHLLPAREYWARSVRRAATLAAWLRR
ncbi:MAG: lasso peptide isopeptide bond-forming cyclase [Chloroflexi bacterium]|nr:lasso peptide isopeptide bond-forming cyclase [Chloroflexota bacterium]